MKIVCLNSPCHELSLLEFHPKRSITFLLILMSEYQKDLLLSKSLYGLIYQTEPWGGLRAPNPWITLTGALMLMVYSR